MENENLLCKLILAPEFYEELIEEGKGIYTLTENGYETEFPALVGDGITLGDCLRIFCETAYLKKNPRYELTEECTIESELYKLNENGDMFNMMITIHYPNVKDSFHEMLVFESKLLEENLCVFYLKGDQRMFAFEQH